MFIYKQAQLNNAANLIQRKNIVVSLECNIYIKYLVKYVCKFCLANQQNVVPN